MRHYRIEDVIMATGGITICVILITMAALAIGLTLAFFGVIDPPGMHRTVTIMTQ